MSYCSKCGNILKEEQKFCGKCGTAVSAIPVGAEEPEAKEVEVSPAKQEREQPIQKKKGKSIKRKVILSLSIIAIVGIVVTVTVLWLDYEKKRGTKIIKDLEAGNYDEAVEYFEEAYDEVPAELVKSLKERLKEVSSLYVAGTVSYEQVKAEIDAIREMDIRKLEVSIEETENTVEELAASRKAFEEGNALLEAGKYAEAIASYQKVITTDANYAVAVSQIVLASMKKAEAEATGGDYITAIETLNIALNISVDNAEVSSKISGYTEDYVTKAIADAGKELSKNNFKGSRNIIKDALDELGGYNDTLQDYLDVIKNSEEKYKKETIATALSEAEAYAQSGDYENAIYTISVATSIYPEDQSLKDALSEYKNAKEDVDVAAAMAKADEYIAAKDYDSAITVLKQVDAYSSDNSKKIKNKLQEIEDMKPVPLTNFAFADSERLRTWDEEAVYDTLGNAYMGNAVSLGISNYYKREGYVTIYLGKAYSVLTGVLACEEGTSSGDVSNVVITDGTEVLYNLMVTRTTVPTSISVDVTGVEWLTIKMENDGYTEVILSQFQLEK